MDHISQAAARMGRLIAETELLRQRVTGLQPASHGSATSPEHEQIQVRILRNELELLDYQILLQEDRLAFTTARGADRHIDAQAATLRKGLDALRQQWDRTRRQLAQLAPDIGTQPPAVTTNLPLEGSSKGAT